MKKFIGKGILMCLTLVLLIAAGFGIIQVAADSYVEPPIIRADLYMTADKSIASPNEAVTFTVNFNLLSGVLSGYSHTRVAVLLPQGLDYVSNVVYIGGAPAVLTISPAATPAGTSIVVSFDNMTNTPGPAQILITANVGSAVAGGALTAHAELYLQTMNLPMPVVSSEQADFTLQIYEIPYPTLPIVPELPTPPLVPPLIPIDPELPMPELPIVPDIPTPPVLPPIPITPEVARVEFNLNGGIRVGGGALVQAVPIRGAAVEPYVFRPGYIFIEWDRSFNYVTYDIRVTARWMAEADIGWITVVPPIYNVIEGHFVDGRDTFTRSCHIALIYYAAHHIAELVNVVVDGRVLTAGVHYIATTGTMTATTAIHLKASYLNTLALGTHSLSVNFRGDVHADTQFTVLAYTNPFYDVYSGNWFYRGVAAMNASGLMQGVSAAQFDPYANMTRGMVVTLLYRFAGEPSIAGFRNPFPDVAALQYYTDAVIWAAANGIVQGHDDGRFAPHELMNHQQFATVLYRYQNALGSLTMDILMDYTYSDFDEISYFARSAVTKMTMQGIYLDMPSDPQGRFLPQAPVTRAKVATVMRLWIESIGW